MILSRMASATAGIERFSTRRMIAERLQAIHYPEVRRLHFHPQVMKTLSVDGQIMPDQITKDGLVQNDAHWKRTDLCKTTRTGSGTGSDSGSSWTRRGGSSAVAD